MNREAYLAVLQGWRRAGLDFGGEPERGDPGMPWFVRIMVLLAAWFSALLLMVVFGLAFLQSDGPLRFQVGGVVYSGLGLGLAYWRGAPYFVEQFALPLVLAGLALFMFGVETAPWPSLAYAVLLYGLCPLFSARFALAGVALGIVLLMGSPISPWLETGQADWEAARVGWTLNDGLAFGLAVVLCWELDAAAVAHAVDRWLRPLAYALVFACAAAAVAGETDWFRQAPAWRPRPEGVSLSFSVQHLLPLLLWLAWRAWHDRQAPVYPGLLVLIFSPFVMLSPLAGAGMLLLLVGYQAQRALPMLMGGASLLLGITDCYYSLNGTLLEKSLLLTGSGALMLLLLIPLHYGKGARHGA